MAKSVAQLVRDREVREASRTRGHCSVCAHTWKPRNPSRGVNRCPGCGLRGNVKYDTLSDEAE